MIRRSEEKDGQSAYKLICILEETAFDKDEFQKIYEETLKNENHVCFVYEQEDEVVALLHMRMEYQLHHCARIAEITELVVLPEYRSKGIGAELLQYACMPKKRIVSVLNLSQTREEKMPIASMKEKGCISHISDIHWIYRGN